jgi:hypothetical protein
MTSPTSDQPSPALPHQSEDCAIHAEAAPKEDRTVPERLDGGTLWHLRAMPTSTREQVDASGGSHRWAGRGCLSASSSWGIWLKPASRRWVDKPGDGRRDPPDAPSSKYQKNRVRVVTLGLRCHNSQKDAPDHEAADAVHPVVPIFRHIASIHLRRPSPNAGRWDTSARPGRSTLPTGLLDISDCGKGARALPDSSDRSVGALRGASLPAGSWSRPSSTTSVILRRIRMTSVLGH